MVGAFLLNLYDAIVTVYATQCLGLAEGNPAMRFLLATSALLFVAVKIVVLGIIWNALRRRYESRPKATRALVVVTFLAFFAVAIWNTTIVLFVIKHSTG